MRFIALIAFLACIPAANWLIGNVGTRCIPYGPCMIPVGFGLMAPSGVLMIGLALVLRDLVQRWLGLGWVLAAILGGALISAAVAPPALVVASATAFLLSELADTAVYTPLAERRATGCAHCMAKQVNSVRRKRGVSKQERPLDMFA